MGDVVVYRCIDPGVAASVNAYPWDRAEHFRQYEALSAEFFPGQDRKVYVTSGGIGGERFAGFQSLAIPPTYDRHKREWVEGTGDDLPKGWRTDKHGAVVPHKGTREGKAYAARLAAIPPLDDVVLRLVGMPNWSMGGGRMWSPGIRFADGEMFVTWGSEPDGVDPEKWERVKLSVYYAAIEAEEAAA